MWPGLERTSNPCARFSNSRSGRRRERLLALSGKSLQPMNEADGRCVQLAVDHVEILVAARVFATELDNVRNRILRLAPIVTVGISWAILLTSLTIWVHKPPCVPPPTPTARSMRPPPGGVPRCCAAPRRRSLQGLPDTGHPSCAPLSDRRSFLGRASRQWVFSLQ